MTIAAILKHKGANVVSIQEGASVAELVQVLATRRIGAVPVLDSNGQLRGIVSERDVVEAFGAHGAAALEMQAARFMTQTPRTGTPATTVAEAMEMMTEGRFRHMPVFLDDKMIGIISIGDVVKARIMQQAQEVDSLKAYVSA